MTRNNCKGFNVYDPKEFYALHYSIAQDAFATDSSITRGVLKKFENATLAHFSNALTATYQITVDSPAAYGLMAEVYCPKVYHSCGEKF